MDRSSRVGSLFREIHELVLAVQVDNPDRKHVDRLELLLRENELARAVYFEYVAETIGIVGWADQEGSGSFEFGVDERVVARLIEEVEHDDRVKAKERAAEQEKLRREATERFRRMRPPAQRVVNRRPEPIVIPYSVVYLGAAVLAASVFWVASTFFTSFTRDGEDFASDHSPAIPIAVPIATISDSILAELVSAPASAEDGRGRPVSSIAGTQLFAGSYQLQSGVVQIQFDSGASVIVEAPSLFSIDSPNSIDLGFGRLVGNVPPEAVGFLAGTPNAKVIDLGTEFGISVVNIPSYDSTTSDLQAVDISVLAGEVEVVADPTPGQEALVRRRLKTDASVRVDVSGDFVAAETNVNRYFREVPGSVELAKKVAYERWLDYSRRLSADPDVIAYYTFNDQQSGDSILWNRAGDGASLHGQIVDAQWDEGRWSRKQALRFAGLDQENPNSYVQVDIPGSFTSLTLSAWICVDDFPVRSGLLMADSWDRPGQLDWMINDRRQLHTGIFHDERAAEGLEAGLQTFSNARFGSIPVSEWCHVAMVLRAAEGDLIFYINGRPVGSSEVATSGPVLLGPSRIGAWKPETESGDYIDDWRTLRGKMDELLIVQRAMSGIELRNLYEAGRP